MVIHVALRKRHFDIAIRYGWIVYLLSVPAAVASIILLLGVMIWLFGLGGFLYLAAILAYWLYKRTVLVDFNPAAR